MSKLPLVTILIISLLCMGMICNLHTNSLPINPPIEITEPHVVVGIEKTLDNGTRFRWRQGCGVVIGHQKNRTYILTAKHATKLEVDTKQYSFKRGVWISLKDSPVYFKVEREANDHLDAAVISTTSIDLPAARISQRRPIIGESVFILGSPIGSYRTIYRRRIARNRSGLHNQFYLDGYTEPGFSGGGVYDYRNKLIGICIARRTDDHNRGICISTHSLRKLIDPYSI